MKSNVLLIILVLIGLAGFAQTEYETAFVNGKSLFNNGQYELAMQAFKPAMVSASSNAFEPFASFYYALSGYRSNYKPLARDMFLQIAEKFPNWKYANESLYWVALIHFETDQLDLALFSTRRLNGTPLESQGSDLQYKFLSQIDSIKILKDLYNNHSENGVLAEVIVKKMEIVPYGQVDIELLNRISEEHQIFTSAHSVPEIIEKKDIYKVAVLFPFIWQNMEASGYYLRKSLVVDLYEGIRYGVKKLEQEGIRIQLITYDTRGDTTVTAELLEKPELLGVDLIIGPLVPGASDLVRDFAYHNKINMINPISNNSSAVSGNPFAFSMNPNEVTLGRKAGEYTIKEILNKNILVYYGARKTDLNMAYAFEEVVAADSFNIMGINMVHHDSTEWIFEYLTAKQYVLDSLGFNVFDGERNKLKEYIIKPDSIGGIFVSTFDYKIAAEVFSSVANRGDAIQIIGHGGWLYDKTANYRYMEDLGIVMMAPDYVDYSSEPYLELERSYIQEQRSLPSKFVIAGYDCMLFVGHCLSRFGVYFQNGLRKEVLKGIGLRHGYDFRTSNDNQYIPLIQFEDLDLRVEEPDNTALIEEQGN